MTIPIIKAIAALIATATLGTGVTGTATAAGLTDTRTDAAATTVTATADTSSLPDHLINGTFDYPTCPGGKASCDVDPTTGWGGFYKDFGGDNKFAPIDNWDRSKFGWDSDQEGMRPDQQPTSHQKLQHCVQLGHANNNNGQKVNRYAEIIAETPTGAIYQDIATVPGVMYRWTLKHASASTSHADSMAVMIGDPGKETAQEATRTTVNGYGDKLGKVGTTITTKGPGVAWETYTGTYIATSTVTRFTYRSLQGDTKLLHTGNWIDDVSFDKAYKLTYDANSSDASGQVPSDTTANTVKQAKAKAKTTGTVRAVADRTASGLTVHDLKNGEIAPVQYGDFKFSTVNGFSADQVTDVKGFTVKTNSNPFWKALHTDGTNTAYFPTKNGASLVLHHVGQWRDSSGAQRWLNARITVNGQNLGFLYYETLTHHFNIGYGKWDKHPSSRPYMDVTVDFLLDDGSTPHGLRGVTGFTDLDGGTSGYNEGVELVSGFDGAYVRSDAHLARFGTNGWAGATDENAKVADAHGMKHYVGATFTGSSFRARWSVASGQARGSAFQPVDSTIAYRLIYDKNAQDAAGSIPSDTAANTTRPAKSETDGKVSDLVQRTTTHADGSVTVKTIDTSTDVVSGCQVYYPVGAKIRLATLAKDDDCWDSTMLTRTSAAGKKMKMLGWSESQYHDDNAGALSTITPTVTMPVGGKTVYAVWVSSGVTLTYNVNTPEGATPPVTPNGITVPYNTVINDTSGWKAGSTTIIPGYRFLGWYTDPRDVIEPTDPRCEIYPNLDMCQPHTVPLYPFWGRALTADITVYAHWERADTQVMYDANGGKGAHAPTDGRQHSTIAMPSDVSQSFSRDGYSFAGWNTKPDGSGVSYKDGDGVPVEDKVVTLYAQWRAKIFVMPEAGGKGGPSPLTVIPAVIAGLALMVGLAGTRRRFKASRQTGRHGR